MSQVTGEKSRLAYQQFQTKSVRIFLPFMCCSWLDWHSGLFPPSLSQKKACPADWAEGLRGLILVSSTWLSPSKASILLCLMWVSSLQRKQLFGWTHRTTPFSLYLETTAWDGSNDKQPQWNQSAEGLMDKKQLVIMLQTQQCSLSCDFYWYLSKIFAFLWSVLSMWFLLPWWNRSEAHRHSEVGRHGADGYGRSVGTLSYQW